MNDKDVKRPYLERDHEAKWTHVPKGLMGLIVLLMSLMGCSGEEAAELVQPETGTAIAFAAEQQKEQAVTRADKPLKDYVQTFKVYGFKNMSGDNTNGYSDLQQVFPGYTVNWKATSTSSSGWEYLNQQPLGQTVQTIKYWDWSAKAYRFFAVAGAEGTNEVTGAYKTYPTYEAYEVTYEADANYDAKIPYYSHLWFSNNNYEDYPDRQYGKPVELVFVKPLSKVRFLFTFEDPSKAAETELTDKEFSPTNGNTIKQKGDVTVTYPLIGTDLREDFSTTSDDEGITALKEDYYESVSPAEGTVTSPYLGANRTPLAREYTVLPAKNQGTYTLKVSVNGDPKSCVVPADFMEWLPGYTYTYIFKVHVDGSVDIDAVQSAFTEWTNHNTDHTVYNW